MSHFAYADDEDPNEDRSNLSFEQGVAALK